MSRRRHFSFELLVGVGAAAFVVALGGSNGGYFPTSWGWSTIVFAWVLVVGFVLGKDSTVLSRLEGVYLAAGAALATWIWLSVTWSADVPQSVLEGERALLYLAAAAALLLVARGRLNAVLGGCLAGIVIVCSYALATRFFPERLGVFDPVAGYRLSTPLGYWNALGLLAAMGSVLALGFFARAKRLTGRAAAGAALVILAPTLHFTFSRGAWISLGIALLFAIAVDPRRLQLPAAIAFAAPAPAVAVALGWRAEALTTGGATIDQAAREGQRVAVAVVLLAAFGALLGVVLGILERRWTPGRALRRSIALAVSTSGVALVVLVFALYGSPISIADRGWRAFSSPPTTTGGSLNNRLFSFSGSGRVDLWSTALDTYRTEPIVGTGSGSYEQAWLERRSYPGKVRDAHSLYLETLAETGPLGLVLLLTVLALPLVALTRARGKQFVSTTAAAYVAYLVHAGVDWDWEMPAVTLTALFVGASVVVAARKPEDEERPMSPRLRYGLLAVTLALTVVAFVGLVGNMSLAQAASAARDGDFARAEAKARRAATWAPWSSEPWQRIGQSQLARDELPAARASFRKAIAKNEGDWELWFDLARASAGRAQRDALAHASRLNPLSPEIAQLRTELGEQGTIQVGG